MGPVGPEGPTGPSGINKNFPFLTEMNMGMRINRDIVGFDIPNQITTNSSIDACNSACISNNDCNFWKFEPNTNNGTCTLKKATPSTNMRLFFKDGIRGRQLSGFDIPGYDPKNDAKNDIYVGNKSVSKDSLFRADGIVMPTDLSCANLCINETTCDYSTYNVNSKLCHLKKATDNKSSILGFPYK